MFGFSFCADGLYILPGAKSEFHKASWPSSMDSPVSRPGENRFGPGEEEERRLASKGMGNALSGPSAAPNPWPLGPCHS